MGFMSEFKKASNGTDAGEVYNIENYRVTCPHCGGVRFDKKQVRVGQSLKPLFCMAENEHTVLSFRCVDCGNVQWFALEPVEEDEE